MADQHRRGGRAEADPKDEDNLAEARGRAGFVHKRVGGGHVRSEPKKPSPWLLALGVGLAGVGISAGFFLAARDQSKVAAPSRSSDGPEDGAAAPLEEVLTLTMFARAEGTEREILSGDSLASDAILHARVVAPSRGFLLLARVAPDGRIDTLYPPRSGGRAAPCTPGKPPALPSIAAARLAPGVHRLLLVHGTRPFDTEGWSARPDGVRVTPGLRVASFLVERP